jgi:large conductance mechanosensitive channel
MQSSVSEKGEVDGMWKEFRDFITKGNLVEIAMAFILGAAFGVLVKSFLDDVIMPLLGKATGNVDFTNLYINLSGQTFASAADARHAGAAAIYYGSFINAVITFLIVAFVMFLLARSVMKSRKPKAAPAPTTEGCPFCKTQIPIGAARCPNCTSPLKTA